MNNGIDIQELAQKDGIRFPKDYITAKEKENRMNTKTVLLSNKVYEYEWIIQLSYYFHVIQLYKNLLPLSKAKIVIKFAKDAIGFIKRQINRAEHNASRSCSSTVDAKVSDDVYIRLRKESA